MEEKCEISPSEVIITAKGDEAIESRTEYQPSFHQYMKPTTVVSSPPPIPPPTTVISGSATAAQGGVSPSEVLTVKGDEALTSRTDFPAPNTLISGSSTAAPPLISSAGSDPTKKKRGRPRKYAPDGSLNPRASRPALSPTPISSSIPLSGDYHHSNWKRGKAQQHQKSHKFEYESNPAPPPPGLSYYVGSNFTTHQFTVNAGEDVTMKVMQQGSRAICILSAMGSISNVTLRRPTTSGGTLTYEGRFEIVSLSGSFMPNENGGTKGRSGGMSISLAGPNGRIIGGGLAGMLIAASPVQVIMGSFIVMHQAEHNQKKKPRILEASPQPQPLQSQPPNFTITTVNSTSPMVAMTEEPKQQPYGGGSVVKPMAQMSSSFHNDNSAMNNFTTTYHGYGNMNTGSNKEEDDYDDDNDSGDTRSLSNNSS